MKVLLFLLVAAFMTPGKGDSACPIYAEKSTILYANETSCKLRSGNETGCYDCCPLDWNCCDNGSCMEYDPFCRYPTNCCKEKYCGNQCCSSAYGVPCGPLCAPSSYFCCNTSTGQLCKKPDTCCGDHCCPDTHFCCSSDHICCEKGTTCCPGERGTSKCCPEGTECCGDHCCPKIKHEQCLSGEPCCPPGRACQDHLCCPKGQFCPSDANTCCDNQWCDRTKRCCHPGSYCNAADGCCQNGQTFCSRGKIDNCFSSPYSVCCSDGGACTPSHPLCRGDYCCPSGYPKLCSGSCHADNRGNCACCGSKCCYPPYGCDGGTCRHCHKKGHWWWRKTVCDDQPNYVSPASPVERPHLTETPTKLNQEARKYSAASIFLSVVRTQRSPADIVQAAVSSVKQSIVLPPAPTKILSPDSFACFRDKQAMQDTCKAFHCMTKMTDCGATGYLQVTISLYCDGISQTRKLFNSAGQKFLTCLQDCVRTKHVMIFEQGIIPCCHSLETWGEGNMQENCFLKCNFCHLFMSNAGAFDKLFNADGDTNIYTLYFKYCHISSNYGV